MCLETLEVHCDDDVESNRLDNPKGLDISSADVHDHDEIDEDDDIETTISIAGDEPNEYVDEASKIDTRRVIRLRILLVLTLVASATIMSCFVYRYIAAHDKKQFHDKFHSDATKVLEAVGRSLERSLSTLDAFSLAYVSYAATRFEQNSEGNNTNTTWPFVTLPDFALHASKILPLTDGVFVSMLPIVCPLQKTQWEEYSVQNDFWVNEAIELQEVWPGYRGEINYNWKKTPHIFRWSSEPNHSQCMLPKWQAFPIATSDDFVIYNFDFNNIQPEAIQQCINKQHAVLSKPFMIPLMDDDLANKKMKGWSKFFSEFLPPEDEAFEPIFDLYYPIVNDLSRNAVLESKSISATTVGMLAIPIYWRSFMRNILTTGSDGIVVVVHNECSRPFTYQINGNRVVYLGVGDNHDFKYHDLTVSSKVVDISAVAKRAVGYSGAAIDMDYCPYTLHIYPSDTMKAAFASKDSTIFAVSVIVIFCFTSCIFVLYDRYVERRQQRVSSAAMRSSAIISSLFPASVQERLFPAVNKPISHRRANDGIEQISVECPIIGSPIAQEYPDTTVIFADIVGFTEWSSSRSPTQVFHLLEMVYAGFDSVARKYGVFKIETIGDCYVAVVGLPKRRENHAMVMVKFASALRANMMEQTQNLEACLGLGTSNLALRIGLNSGPTTAGVLRGEKARFQLFGDTVNTAARMETNGAPCKIHVSDATAELLKAAGKGHWLDARQDQIVAKGKGLMQTYWCEPNAIGTLKSLNDDSISNDQGKQ